LGKEPHWVEKSKGLIQAATQQCETNSDVAVQVANSAFELALRGLARVLKVEDADTLSIAELIDKMDKSEDVLARASTYWDHRNHNYIRDLATEWFFIPMEIHDIETVRPDLGFSQGARVYVQELRELIMSYYDKKVENE
jgi:HEPN domain-containing protein